MTATLFISAILVVVVASAATVQLNTARQSQNSTEDRHLFYLAESCLEEAIYRIEQDSGFTSTTLPLGDGTCEINASGALLITLDVTVTDNRYTQTYQGTISITEVGIARNASLLTWREV